MPVTVKRRLVFYCPGYDAAAGSRYRRLFVAEFARLSERFAIKTAIGPVETDDVETNDEMPSTGWSVVANGHNWRTETRYEILRWDDLIRRDLNRTWRQRGPLLFAGVFAALREGVIARLFRIDWHFALGLCYPVVILLGLVLTAPAIGYGLACLLSQIIPLPTLVTITITIAVGTALMRAAQPLLRKAYVYHVTDDWIFHWQHIRGERPDFDARLDRFGERIAASVQASRAQEVLVVGHSTGAILAVEALARALALDTELATEGPRLVLLTLGSRIPVAAFWCGARRFRQAITSLITAPAILWVDYQAPQDIFNAFRFDPLRHLDLDLGSRVQANPVIRSPKFKLTIRPDIYRRLRWNFFQMHFQFLAATARPDEYDYLMIACGPVFLADRIADPSAAVMHAYGEPEPATISSALVGGSNSIAD